MLGQSTESEILKNLRIHFLHCDWDFSEKYLLYNNNSN